MKVSNLALTLALAATGLVCSKAHADTLSFTITNPTQVITAGGTVEYDATVSAPGTNSGVLYLNGDSYTVVSPLSIDDSAFFDFPLSLAPNTSFTGALFDISVLADTAAGTFNSSFQILGGASADSQDVLASQNFTTVVAPTATVTPEPSSLILLGTGLAGAVAGLRRRQA